MEELNQQESGMGMPPEPRQSSSVGPVVGSVIIIVIVVLGGLYFWGQRQNAALPADEQTQKLETTSGSDAVSDIEADLNATELDSLDAELDELETEINTELGV